MLTPLGGCLNAAAGPFADTMGIKSSLKEHLLFMQLYRRFNNSPEENILLHFG